MKELTISDFAASFGTSDTFSPGCKSIINRANFKYEKFNKDELNQLHKMILKHIQLDKQKIGAKSRIQVWQDEAGKKI